MAHRPRPVVGSEIEKTRPCLVISPDEMNEPLKTVPVAPTTTLRSYPTRVNLTKNGQVAPDQLRAVDRQRLVRRLGAVSTKPAHEVSSVLVGMFVR
jgi:mRNA interferase MazF